MPPYHSVVPNIDSLSDPRTLKLAWQMLHGEIVRPCSHHEVLEA